MPLFVAMVTDCFLHLFLVRFVFSRVFKPSVYVITFIVEKSFELGKELYKCNYLAYAYFKCLLHGAVFGD